MSVRVRRLEADYRAMRRLAHHHPRIEVEGVGGKPPDRYRLVLHVRSLRRRMEKVVVADKHRLEVVLPRGYPRDAPLCRMLTPVFHPNIAPHAVCVGDHWSAAESLSALVQRVGEMLAFQSYNVKSPLNGLAAEWVAKHPGKLPIDPREFFLDLSSAPPEPEAEAEACANCGTRGAALADCGRGHRVCPDCTTACPDCGAKLCLACGATACPECAGPDCANCGAPGGEPAACPGSHDLCPDCTASCGECGKVLCLLCGQIPCPDCTLDLV